MPPRATSNNGFRGTGPFKPPRPSSKPSPSGHAGSSSSAAAPSKRIEISDDDDAEDAGAETEAATDEENDGNDGKRNSAAATPSGPALPPALLSRLLSHFFQNPKGTQTRLTQDAHASIDKYMEIFIREAVARSVAARTDEAFLDVDVLQKVAGQLIMDM